LLTSAKWLGGDALIKSVKKWIKKSWFDRQYGILMSRSWNGYQELSYKDYAFEAYQRNPIAFRAVNLVADSVAGVPWKLYRKMSDNRDVEIEQHPVIDLLKCPNPNLSEKDFFTRFVQYRQISGNAYVRSVGPNFSRTPKELYLLRPDRIYIKEGYLENCPDEFEGLIYEYRCGRHVETLDLHNFYHSKTWNPLCDYYGQSVIEPAFTSIKQLNEALQWNVSLLKNSASPSGIITTMGNFTDEQSNRIKSLMERDHQGVWNSGRPLVLEGGTKFEQMGLSPKDMDWLKGIELATKNICLAIGVDPALVGDSTHRTYNTFKDAEKSLYHSTVLPILDQIRDDFLNRWLLPRFPNTENMFFQYDIEAIEVLSETRNELWGRMISGVQAGIIDVNEAREELGYTELIKEELPTEDIPKEEDENNGKHTDPN
jgi:HK97 family phage portal protein